MNSVDIRNEIPARDIERMLTKALEFSASARSLILSMLLAGFERLPMVSPPMKKMLVVQIRKAGK